MTGSVAVSVNPASSASAIQVDADRTNEAARTAQEATEASRGSPVRPGPEVAHYFDHEGDARGMLQRMLDTVPPEQSNWAKMSQRPNR